MQKCFLLRMGHPRGPRGSSHGVNRTKRAKSAVLSPSRPDWVSENAHVLIWVNLIKFLTLVSWKILLWFVFPLTEENRLISLS